MNATAINEAFAPLVQQIVAATLAQLMGPSVQQPPAVPQHPAPDLMDAVASCLREKQDCGYSTLYIAGLRGYLTLFSDFIGSVPVNQVDLQRVEAWFATRPEAPRSRQSNTGRLSSLFSHCVRKGWIASNPCDRLPTVKLPELRPKILQVDECRKLLDVCRSQMPVLLPWVVIGLFCGARPSEIQRLSWDKVNAKTIVFDLTKTGRRRIMPIDDQAAAWLATCRRTSGPVCPSPVTVRRKKRKLADLMRWPEWPQDVLRHTAASYLLARHQDAYKVALWLGNSPRILMRHYAELVNAEALEAFSKLMPR